MPAEKPLHRKMVDFCKYHLGKECFASFTGQDVPTWNAFVYLLQCYAHGGGEPALLALKATVRCAQGRESVLRVFVQAIPGVLDWGDVARLWPMIVGETYLDDIQRPARDLFAIERTEVVRGNRAETLIWRHGLGAPVTHQVVAGASR